jgi:hypothetical protein
MPRPPGPLEVGDRPAGGPLRARAKPIATSFLCATSARIFPCDRSTHSSNLGMNPSITLARGAGAPGTSRPSSRART